MKRIIAVVLALCALVAAAGAEGVREAVELIVDGRTVALNFDSSAEYSIVTDGKVQASFYAYVDNTSLLYELTLTFPEDVRAGDVIDTQYAVNHNPDCAVVALFSGEAEVVYYFAGVVDGAAYPSESSFAIAFDSVERTDAGTRYAGHVTASLTGMDVYSDSGIRHYEINAAPFSFTMPDANRRAEPLDPFAPEPSDGYNPFDDGATPAPAATPAPTRDLVRV